MFYLMSFILCDGQRSDFVVVVAVIVVLISYITYVYIEKVFMDMGSRVVISKHKLYMSRYDKK